MPHAYSYPLFSLVLETQLPTVLTMCAVCRFGGRGSQGGGLSTFSLQTGLRLRPLAHD